MFSPAATAPIYCPLYHEEYQQDYPNKEYGQDSQDCTHTPVTEYFIELCQGQKTCNITASPQQLGAPVCEDQFVYLKTVYACVDMRTLLEEYVDRKQKPTSKTPLIDTETPALSISFETENKASETSDKLHIKTSEKINVDPTQDTHFNEPETNEIFAIDNNAHNLENKVDVVNKTPTKTAIPEKSFTSTSIKDASSEKVAKKEVVQNNVILDSIATGEYNILSDDINLDILPLEQDPNTVSVVTTDTTENILEYFEQYRVIIGGILVVVLVVLLVSILCILAIPLIHTCKQQQKQQQQPQQQHKLFWVVTQLNLI